MTELRPDTLAVRGGLARSAFEETSEALFLTSGFVYDTAEEAEAAFKGEIDRFVYSRYGNPTVAMFEERMRLLEGAEACFATASGMSAVFVALAALLGQGDRVVSSRGAVRLVLRHPRRDPAAVGRRDRLRRRPRPRPVARGAVRADHGGVLRDAEQPDAGARRHPGGRASWPTPPARRWSSTTSSARRCSPGRWSSAPTSSSTPPPSTSTARAAPSAARPRHRGVHRRPGAEPHAAHRPVDVAVQRVGAAQGPGDAVAAGGAAGRRGPGAGAGARGQPEGLARCVYPLLESHPQHELAKAPDVRRRHRRHLRARRRQGRGLRADERAADHRHLQQPRRLQVADHPPGDHDAPPAGRRRRGGGRASPTACCGSRSAWRTCATWSTTSSAPWPATGRTVAPEFDRPVSGFGQPGACRSARRVQPGQGWQPGERRHGGTDRRGGAERALPGDGDRRRPTRRPCGTARATASSPASAHMVTRGPQLTPMSRAISRRGSALATGSSAR